MKIGGVYSFKQGREVIERDFAAELAQVQEIIGSVDGSLHRTKVSREKTMPGRKLYKPSSLNQAFSRAFEARQWQKYKVLCDYPTEFYTEDFTGCADHHE